MTINITNSIGQHKIPQRITQKQNTQTFLPTWVRAWPIWISYLPGLQVSTTGSSCWPVWWWVLVKSKMRDAATQNWRRNERAKRWIFREIAKWRRWRHAPQLMAPLLRLFTSARSRLLFRSWRQRQLPRTRVVVFRRNDTLLTKNFTGDDQATLTVDRNSAIYFVYVYEIATNAPAAASRLMAASRDRSNGT